MKRALCLVFGLVLGMINALNAQQSSNTVNYQVTFNSTTQTYTAWVVPNYAVPNANNATSNEIGATAQFTIVVPKAFVIQNITDVRGTWEKAPDKLGQGQVINGVTQTYASTIPNNVAYYVIGKTTDETNYGAFANGTPVALFTFKSSTCFGPVRVLPPGDPFISAANTTYSLNVANSFYSRSGQPAGGNVDPREQFSNVTGGPALCSSPYIYAYDDDNITNQNTAVSGNVLTNDDLATGTGPLTVTTTPVQAPANGTVVLNANGTYTYTPTNGFTGNDRFVYRVCDSGNPAICDEATVTISVRPTNPSGNNPPVAIGDKFATTQEQPVSGNVILNDKDPDAGQTITASVIQQPTNGILTFNPNGTFTYTPTTGFTGDDFFLYRVCDNGTPVLCDTARVDLNVYPANAGAIPPTANDDLFFRAPTGTATGNIIANDKDNSNTGLDITTTPVSGPSNGTVVINSDGTFTYTPNAGYTGGDSFRYQVCDRQNPKQCATATVFILTRTVSTGSADLKVTKVADKKTAVVGDEITYRVVVKNLGTDAATNVALKDSLMAGMQFVSATVNKGTYSNLLWTIPNLAAGDSAVLTLKAKLLGEGVWFNTAKIISSDQNDPVSDNNEASACTTVPVKLCTGEKVEVTVPATYTNVQWFKNGGTTAVATGNVVLLTEIGTYTYTATNGACPAGGCCPVIIEAGVNCCPVQLCVPVAVKKRKK